MRSKVCETYTDKTDMHRVIQGAQPVVVQQRDVCAVVEQTPHTALLFELYRPHQRGAAISVSFIHASEIAYFKIVLLDGTYYFRSGGSHGRSRTKAARLLYSVRAAAFSIAVASRVYLYKSDS